MMSIISIPINVSDKITKTEAMAKIERDNSIYGEMKKMVDLYLSAGK